MKRLIMLSLLAVAAAGTSFGVVYAAQAGGGAPAPREQGESQGVDMFARIDANGDGMISRDEFYRHDISLRDAGERPRVRQRRAPFGNTRGAMQETCGRGAGGRQGMGRQRMRHGDLPADRRDALENPRGMMAPEEQGAMGEGRGQFRWREHPGAGEGRDGRLRGGPGVEKARPQQTPEQDVDFDRGGLLRQRNTEPGLDQRRPTEDTPRGEATQSDLASDAEVMDNWQLLAELGLLK